MSTVISELQLFLPSWVRARAIAVYLVVFPGSQALASPVWGLITQHAGLRTAVLVAAVPVAASALGGLVWEIPDSQHLNRSPAAYWGPATSPSNRSRRRAGRGVGRVRRRRRPRGAIPHRDGDLRLSRLRSGASRWELHRVGESPEVFVEQFQIRTWAEHLQQHEGRLTGEEEAIEAAAFAHVLGTPRTRHYLPLTTARTDPAPPDITSRPSGPL